MAITVELMGMEQTLDMNLVGAIKTNPSEKI